VPRSIVEAAVGNTPAMISETGEHGLADVDAVKAPPGGGRDVTDQEWPTSIGDSHRDRADLRRARSRLAVPVVGDLIIETEHEPLVAGDANDDRPVVGENALIGRPVGEEKMMSLAVSLPWLRNRWAPAGPSGKQRMSSGARTSLPSAWRSVGLPARTSTHSSRHHS
jgi:hypothetical protein